MTYQVSSDPENLYSIFKDLGSKLAEELEGIDNAKSLEQKRTILLTLSDKGGLAERLYENFCAVSRSPVNGRAGGPNGSEDLRAFLEGRISGFEAQLETLKGVMNEMRSYGDLVAWA